MAKTDGYGMDAKGARSPDRMPPTKSSPDSGKPNDQYTNPAGPGNPSRSTKDKGDSGKPSAQHSGF